MRLFSVAVAVLLALAFTAQADDKKEEKKGKIDKAKLVGTWALEKSEGDIKVSIKMEFTKDDKLNVTLGVMGNEIKVNGTYKLEGDKLSVTMKDKDKEKTDTMTVKEVTDKKLTLADKSGKSETFERAK